jgi:hypothetical protein
MAGNQNTKKRKKAMNELNIIPIISETIYIYVSWSEIYRNSLIKIFSPSCFCIYDSTEHLGEELIKIKLLSISLSVMRAYY